MSERFQQRPLPLAGLTLLERKPIGDARGWLQRMFCAEDFATIGVGKPIAQINLTRTERIGTVRGMHFQRGSAVETKIVSCLRGRVFDVAVDLRRDSPTFLLWHAEVLSPEAMNSLVIPEGFAHGFQALSDDCEMLYFHTTAYQPASEGGCRPLDPALGIRWPLEVTDMSARDREHPLITSSFTGIDA